VAARNENSVAEVDERQLLVAMRSGDRSAAETMAARTYRAVFASLVRLCGDSDLAADLTQETYRKAWEAFASFDGRSKVSTWLYRIAYTTFLNHIRRPMLIAPVDVDIADPGPSIETTIAESERAERLRRAVLALPEELRFTVTGRFWGDLSVADIAQLEGVTVVAIRKRLARAFRLLEMELHEELS
jgi:RNA polymerase sigma-70 factor, ECF subfamily